MPFVYIVECRDGSYYVGSTWNLERRVSEHNLGLGAAYTRTRRPVKLAWAAECQRITDAYRFEKQVQGWSRAKRTALIESRWEDLPGLSKKGFRPAQAGFDTGPGGPGSTNGSVG